MQTLIRIWPPSKRLIVECWTYFDRTWRRVRKAWHKIPAWDGKTFLAGLTCNEWLCMDRCHWRVVNLPALTPKVRSVFSPPWTKATRRHKTPWCSWHALVAKVDMDRYHWKEIWKLACPFFHKVRSNFSGPERAGWHKKSAWDKIFLADLSYDYTWTDVTKYGNLLALSPKV